MGIPVPRKLIPRQCDPVQWPGTWRLPLPRATRSVPLSRLQLRHALCRVCEGSDK
jgi:hypothetical protein